MRLGIIVTYLLNPGNEKLLDIHLSNIFKHTVSNFRIYANVNMLPDYLINNLNRDRINIVKYKDYEGDKGGLRASYELSHYSEYMINLAIKDGMTHIVMLHPDSFPVKRGWDRLLLDELITRYGLVSIFPAMSALLFFSSDFYKKYTPTLLPPHTALQSKSYKEFERSIDKKNLFEPGMGYAYTAYLNNNRWTILKKTNKKEDHYHFGSIFNDIVFHLGAAEHDDRSFANYEEAEFLPTVKRITGKILPPVIKEKLRSSKLKYILRPEIKHHQIYHSKVKEKLFSDPDGYIKYLKE
jgi:hypothetical protein